jgi:6-phospho-3-hexuloisomerase
METDINALNEARELILTELKSSLESIDPNQTAVLIDAILLSEKVFYVGVGRVLLAMKAMAKRLSHLGLSVHCVGDITEPAITEKDLLIVASGSGESTVPVAIARKAKSLKARIAHIGSNPESSLMPITDIFLRIPVKTKLNRPDELVSNQPMTTLFDQSLYLLGDAICMVIARRKGLSDGELWMNHANLE